MQQRAFFALLLLVACSARRAPPAPPAPASPRLTLGEALHDEAASRPAGSPSVEQVLAALRDGGVTVEGWKQVLATPVAARFCMAGRTAQGVGVAVCEYASPVDAATGMSQSHARFDRLIPNRSLRVNRQALLTLTRPTAAPALEAEAERLIRLFAAL